MKDEYKSIPNLEKVIDSFATLMCKMQHFGMYTETFVIHDNKVYISLEALIIFYGKDHNTVFHDICSRLIEKGNVSEPYRLVLKHKMILAKVCTLLELPLPKELPIPKYNYTFVCPYDKKEHSICEHQHRPLYHYTKKYLKYQLSCNGDCNSWRTCNHSVHINCYRVYYSILNNLDTLRFGRHNHITEKIASIVKYLFNLPVTYKLIKRDVDLANYKNFVKLAYEDV